MAFLDVQLTEDEINLVCGVYEVATGPILGNGTYQTAEMSWFPKPAAWKGSGLNCGYWTQDTEVWYQDRLQKIQAGNAQLFTNHKWRELVKFNKNVRKAHDKANELAKEYLHKRLKRVVSSLSIASQQTVVKPLFWAASRSFDLASRASSFELCLVKHSSTEKPHPTVEDVFGDGEELTDLSDLDGEPEPDQPLSPPLSVQPNSHCDSDNNSEADEPNHSLPPKPPHISPSNPPASPLVGTKRPADNAGQSNRNKRRKRARKAAKVPAEPTPGPSDRAIQEALLRSKKPQEVPLQAHEFDAAYSAHTGKLGKKKVAKEKDKKAEQDEREAEYDVEELVTEQGFDHIEWDG
ncbi:hypothetical protein V5O48_019099, partial [Marasmius crinis-equi]